MSVHLPSAAGRACATLVSRSAQPYLPVLCDFQLQDAVTEQPWRLQKPLTMAFVVASQQLRALEAFHASGVGYTQLCQTALVLDLLAAPFATALQLHPGQVLRGLWSGCHMHWHGFYRYHRSYVCLLGFKPKDRLSMSSHAVLPVAAKRFLARGPPTIHYHRKNAPSSCPLLLFFLPPVPPSISAYACHTRLIPLHLLLNQAGNLPMAQQAVRTLLRDP